MKINLIGAIIISIICTTALSNAWLVIVFMMYLAINNVNGDKNRIWFSSVNKNKYIDYS